MVKEHDQLFERVIQFVKQSHSKLQSHKVDHKTPVEKDQVPSFDIRPHSREIPTAALLAGEDPHVYRLEMQSGFSQSVFLS